MLKKIKKSYNYLFKKENRKAKFPVEIKGNNWIEKPNLPIAIFFGFNPWKRDIFNRFFPQYRTAFVLGNNLYSKSIYSFLKDIKKNNELILINWGEKPLPYLVKIFLANNKSIKVINIEDGFIRSFEVGILHTRPSSICMDEKGIYFNADKRTNIEHLLNTFDFKDKEELLYRATNCIKLIKNTGLSKYYDGISFLKEETFKKSNNYSILVVGQVEDDASIKYGSSKIKTNLDLVKEAKKDFPDAEIYFRPHPDYIHQNRKNSSKMKLIKEISIILNEDIPLTEILIKVDHVYTITSLVGLEALIHDKEVTTCGIPFYSNWGLTKDKFKIKDRRVNKTLEELFAIAYLKYPKYFHLTSDEEVNFEDTAYYFLFETIKDNNIFELNENKIFKEISSNDFYKYIPLEVLKYLVNTKFPAEGDTNKILEIIKNNFKLRDYPQISYILINTANYDALVEYSNLCLKDLEANVNTYINNTILLDNFFYSLSLSQRNSNGRVINKIPDLIKTLLSKIGNDKYFLSILKNYTTSCSNNLQYDIIEKLIAKIASQNNIKIFDKFWNFDDFVQNSFDITINNNIYKLLLQVLNIKPSRSERNIEKRHQLKNLLSEKYLKNLNDKYTTKYDAYLNRCLYYLSVDKVLETEKELNNYLNLLNTNSIINFVISNNRLKDIINITNYLIKKKRITTIDKYIEQIRNIDNIKNMDSLYFTMLSYYKMKNKLKSFYNLIDRLPKELRKSDKIQGLEARVLREQEYFEASLKLYNKLYNSAKTLARKAALKSEIDKIKFIIESSNILNSVPQPKFPKGVVLIASQTCFNTLAMMLPSYVELKRKGYAVINLTQGMTVKDQTNLDFIDKFHGVIPLNLTNSATIKDLSNSWEIDWDNKKVISNNINFYQGFYERLSTYLRKYYVDLNQYDANKEFINQLVRVDTCLKICKDIYQELVINKNIPITFVSGNSHVTPYSVFRDFARFKNDNNLGFINCNVAYESYFSNLGSKFANTMCVTDMTLYPTIRAPFMPRRDQFEKWYKKNQSNSEYIEKANLLINVNRVGSSTNDKELQIIKFLKEKKKEGKKIVCAFGKVPVDLNVPFDGGPAHDDMADWLNHTVKICSESKDIILLVKPHPHELRPEIALDLIGGFNDLIREDITENILTLGHKDINGHALAPYLDLAILYNGSSSLELASQGIPVIMASYFGKYDYPVDLNYPKNREDYKTFIQSLNYPFPSDETRKKAAFLMSYMGTDEISILNQYSIRQLTNDKVGIPKWRKEKIKKFLNEGDDKMELIANRIVEKFEKN